VIHVPRKHGVSKPYASVVKQCNVAGFEVNRHIIGHNSPMSVIHNPAALVGVCLAATKMEITSAPPHGSTWLRKKCYYYYHYYYYYYYYYYYSYYYTVG